MTDPTVIAAAIVTVIAALVGGTVTVINATAAARDRETARVARAQLQTTANTAIVKTDDLLLKAQEIHTLTNSNLSKVTAALDLALQENSSLKKLMATMLASSQEAARLAASSAAAVTLAQAKQDARSLPTSPDGTIVQIEHNTRETADALKKETP
jgi:hypothetical protein